jgi:hypothetical protein
MSKNIGNENNNDELPHCNIGHPKYNAAMKVSFDLDDTLILSHGSRLCEPPPRFPFSLFYRERLRKGTAALCHELSALGCEICVYTTSERPTGYIRRLFRLHGIRLGIVVNRQIHEALVQGNRKEIMPSKVPSRFGIALHVDDDATVRDNGIAHGFRVLIVNRDDDAWAGKVLNELKKIMKMKTRE